jgi:hypothetical protein
MKPLSGLLGAVGWGVLCGATAFLAASPAAAAKGDNAPGKMSLAPAPERDSYRGPPPLLSGQKVKIGGYAGVGAAYTRFMGRDSGLVSLEGAFLLDHRLSFGLAGYGFTRTPSGPDAFDGSAQQFGAGYGGLAVRYSVFGNWPVYGTFGLVLGAGAVGLAPKRAWNNDSSWDDDDDDWEDDDAWKLGRFDPFLVVQPEVALNANVVRWLRVGATAGYRFTNGVGKFDLDESDLNGIVIGANLQLGWF